MEDHGGIMEARNGGNVETEWRENGGWIRPMIGQDTHSMAIDKLVAWSDRGELGAI